MTSHAVAANFFYPGSEGSGLPTEVLDLCDQLITIPAQHKGEIAIDSLNVSVATGKCTLNNVTHKFLWTFT